MHRERDRARIEGKIAYKSGVLPFCCRLDMLKPASITDRLREARDPIVGRCGPKFTPQAFIYFDPWIVSAAPKEMTR